MPKKNKKVTSINKIKKGGSNNSSSSASRVHKNKSKKNINSTLKKAGAQGRNIKSLKNLSINRILSLYAKNKDSSSLKNFLRNKAGLQNKNPYMDDLIKIRTNHDIQNAVKLWKSDPAAAEEQYGHFSNWDLSRVTIDKHKLRELALKIIQKNKNTTNIGRHTPPMLNDIENFLKFSKIKESEYQQIFDSDDAIALILDIRSRTDNYRLFFKSGDNEQLPWIVNSSGEKFLVFPDLEIFFNNQIFRDMVDDLIQRDETQEDTFIKKKKSYI